MSPHIPHYAANDVRFVVTPFRRPRQRLTLVDAPPSRPAPAMEFFIARNGDDLEAAAALVRRCYGWRGYEFRPQVSAGGETTLLARCNGTLVGTLTVRCGVRQRLHAEHGFSEQIGELRQRGRRLVEYTRFAIDREVAGRPGRDTDLALELIRRALLLGQVALAATDCVIEVNPRHARYYQREFGFRPCGTERTCERVGAPARLLHLNLDTPPDCVVNDAAGRPGPMFN